jgi:hypothetical protein
MTRLCLAIAVLLGGCTLYFRGDDDCGSADDVAAFELRNPDTGQCEFISGGGGCEDSCAPCADSIAIPDWGSCFSECDGLDEGRCLVTPRCRAAYTNDLITDGPPSFNGCWAIAPSGPAVGEACDGLDAYSCSRHDDCSAVYNITNVASDPEGMEFALCKAEQVDACTAIDCGPGSHCEQQCKSDGTCGPVCVPDDTTCGPNTCPPNTECVQKCDGQDPNNPGCGVCTIECVPKGTCETLATEGECAARADCAPVYAGSDCTCDANGNCTCEILTYERCEPRP